jgi:hypothetical protein
MSLLSTTPIGTRTTLPMLATNGVAMPQFPLAPGLVAAMSYSPERRSYHFETSIAFSTSVPASDENGQHYEISYENTFGRRFVENRTKVLLPKN